MMLHPTRTERSLVLVPSNIALEADECAHGFNRTHSSSPARSKRFHEAFAALPPQVQAQARVAYEPFRREPFHPSLRFKQVLPTRSVFSARAGLAYRALAVREGMR